jgi:polar amino acid transport system substrate-binding protein
MLKVLKAGGALLPLSVFSGVCKIIPFSKKTYIHQAAIASFLGIILQTLLFGVSFASPVPDIEKIKKKGFLTVALVHEHSPPFFMKDNKEEFFGLDVELAKRIAAELGVKIKFIDTAKSYDEAVTQVSDEIVDMAMCKLTSNVRRAQSVSFTKPYITLNHAILLNRIKNYDFNKEDINLVIEHMNQPTSTIAVVKGTAYVDYAKHDFPKAQIVQVDTVDQLFKAVVNGDVKFALKDESDVKTWIHLNPENSIRVKVVLNKNRKDPISIAVTWDKPYLLNWLNLFIDNENYDGHLESLKKYYLEGFEWTRRKS